MTLAVSIFFLGCWIIVKNNIQLSNKLRLLFLFSFIFHIVLTFLVNETWTNIVLTLVMSFFTLACTGFILDLASNNRLSQIILLIISMFVGIKIGRVSNQGEYSTKSILAPDPHGEILVEIDNNYLPAVEKIALRHKINLKRAFYPSQVDITDLDDYFLLNVDDSANLKVIFEEFNNVHGVKWIEWNEIIPFDQPIHAEKINSPNRVLSNDPSAVMQWHLSFLEMEKYYNYIRNNNIYPKRKSKLFILDTGIETDHEDLPKHNWTQKDKNGHGTHCAGVAAAITNNKIGVASMSPGVDWIDIFGIQVIGEVGFGTQKSIIEGIIQAADSGADVISMSLGGITNQEREKAYNDAVKYANRKGSIVVVAAGNANLDSRRYSPANASNVITVSSINENLIKSGFSNHVENIQMGISAPGERILSTTPSNTYTSYNGTSMATPQVAGLIAVMKAIAPELKTQETYEILKNTGKETLNTKRTGKLIQPYEAIKLLTGNKSN